MNLRGLVADWAPPGSRRRRAVLIAAAATVTLWLGVQVAQGGVRRVALLRATLASGDRVEYGYAYRRLSNPLQRSFYHYLTWRGNGRARTYFVFEAPEPNWFRHPEIRSSVDGSGVWVESPGRDHPVCALDLETGVLLDTNHRVVDPSLPLPAQARAPAHDDDYPPWAVPGGGVRPPQAYTWRYLLVS